MLRGFAFVVRECYSGSTQSLQHDLGLRTKLPLSGLTKIYPNKRHTYKNNSRQNMYKL